MRKMTCRPRLRQRLRRGENGLIFVAAIGLGLMVTFARGGSLDAPAGPGSAASAMWTLNDIYNKLNTWTNITKRTGGFTEPTAGPTSGTMHTLNEIMTLVTNSNHALVPQTGQTNTYAVGDDGTNRIGVAWPNPRFTVVGAPGTPETNQIRDNLTGLIWAQNANLASNTTWATGWSSVKGTCTWYQAFDVITNSAGPVNGAAKYGGTNDWRLPNRRELDSLVNLSPNIPSTWLNTQGFTSVQSDYYWSSSTGADYTDAACYVYLRLGYVSSITKVTAYYVWPVRGGR